MRTMLIAVGGNSLIRAGETGTIAEQRVNARRTAGSHRATDPRRLPLGGDAWERSAGGRAVAAIGTGFGPGARPNARRLRRRQPGGNRLPALAIPCDELAAAHLDVPVASIVTQTVVLADDPAMQHPTKPIGPFYSRQQAEERQRHLGWQIVEDAARGYRRVVPLRSPSRLWNSESSAP